MAAFRFIDLFAGIGGFHHALSHPAFGGECVLAVEIDPASQDVYRRSFPCTPLAGDIRAITRTDAGADRPSRGIASRIPEHEVLCGGFPCQPFSKSGAQMGVRDSTRGTLFFDILQILRARRPRFLILENVRNLAGPRHRATWTTIIRSLRDEGYRVADEPTVFSPHNLPPSFGGCPQVRERVFILGERVEDGVAQIGGVRVENEPVLGWNPERWRVERSLLPDRLVRDRQKYALRVEEQAWLDAWAAFVREVPDETLPGFPIWVDAFVTDPSIPTGTPAWKANFLTKNSHFYVRHRDLIDRWLERSWLKDRTYRVAEFPRTRRQFEWQARSFQPRRRDRDLWELIVHLRPSGIRVKPPTYVPALVAITQTSIVASRRRRITPVEAARLQAFPDDVYQDGTVPDRVAYKQLGNAVNVAAVRWVARALFADAGLSWGADLYSETFAGAQDSFRWASAAS